MISSLLEGMKPRTWTHKHGKRLRTTRGKRPGTRGTYIHAASMSQSQFTQYVLSEFTAHVIFSPNRAG